MRLLVILEGVFPCSSCHTPNESRFRCCCTRDVERKLSIADKLGGEHSPIFRALYSEYAQLWVGNRSANVSEDRLHVQLDSTTCGDLR
jgi:hypothetical protein